MNSNPITLISKVILTKIGADGLMHFSISASATAVLKQGMNRWLAALIVFICGILKEIAWDWFLKKGTPQWKDIWCDAAGCIVGAL